MATTARVKVWNSGDVLTAADLNAEFNNLLTGGINNIQDANVASGAAIQESKVAFSGTGHGHTGGTDGKLISVNRAFAFYIAGVPSVANDLSNNYIAPEALTAKKIWAHCKTPPTGSGMTMRVYNITQGVAVASITIAQSGSDANSTSITTSAINAGDVLRIDVTTADSNSVGASISVVLECSQP